MPESTAMDPRMQAHVQRKYPGPAMPHFETAQPASGPTTNELLRDLISEVRGLRADMKAKDWLPDTPFVRRIMAELNRK